jgi:hypothetical protein
MLTSSFGFLPQSCIGSVQALFADIEKASQFVNKQEERIPFG